HMLAEARKIAGPGAAGIDGGGDAGGAAKFLGVDAERSAAPIDMGMQVDQPGGDDGAGDVADIRARIGFKSLPDHGDLAAREGDVGRGIQFLGRVDHPSPAQDQIERHDCPQASLRAKQSSAVNNLDCFVAYAPRSDDGKRMLTLYSLFSTF